MEPEERDRKKAFIFEYKREKEPFPLTPSKQTLFSIHDSGRSQPLHTNIAPFVSAKKKGQERGEEERKSIWKRVSGSALCKVTVVVYLLGCVLVSALYVALYGGQSQKLFAASDAWIPGKPTQPPPKHPSSPPSIPPLLFVDAPYTEWMSQRWTYYGDNFSDWPSLPPFIDGIQQVSSGKIGGEEGVWFLTNSSLYFVLNLDGGSPEDVVFIDIGTELDIDITTDSQIAVDVDERVYVATPFNVTLLDCAPDPKYTCTVVAFMYEDAEIEWNMVVAAVVSVSDGRLWLGTDSGLYFIDRNKEMLTVHNMSLVEGNPTRLAWRAGLTTKDKQKKAAFLLDPQVSRPPRQYLAHSGRGGVHSTVDTPHREGARSNFGLLVVGTKERVYFYDGTMWWFEWVSVWYEGQGGAFDGPPSALSFAISGELFIGNNVSVTRVNINYTFDRLGPQQGLPYDQIQSLYHSPYNPQIPPAMMRSTEVYNAGTDGILWVGSSRGFALFDVSSSVFRHYFYGRRWHPGESVLGFAGSGGNATVVLTDGGIAVVYPQLWTLEEKAAHYQAMMKRHTRPPGLVADCDLTAYIPSTCTPHSTDNDGLWTSIALAAEAFRYKVTGDLDAHTTAWSLFQGMQFLNNVTGVRGLMARSVVSENETVHGGVWHNSSTEPGWRWKGDTSSDEVVGHMFAFPLVHDLVASTPEEKTQARELVDDIVGYIHNNSYYLIDVTNHSTTWGVWNPQPINFNYSWSDEHGLNSLQIVTYLLSAYRITGREEYLQAWKDLSSDSGMYEGFPTHYGLNLVNQKITFPRDDNFSDDELAFLPYFLYFYTSKLSSKQWSQSPLEDQILDYVTLSLQRTWRVVGRERSSLWTAIYAYALDLANDPDLIEALVWNLRTWPLELVEWNTTNSHRLDITFNPEQDRNFRSDAQSERVLPANERTQLRWNANPFTLDSGGSDAEMDPGAWLLPYWMARWIKML